MQTLFEHESDVHELLSLHPEDDVQQLDIGVCWQTLFTHWSVVQELLSLGQVQGAIHKLVSKVQTLEHFNVPVYPEPKTPAQDAPPNSTLSHFSLPSLIPFPHI